MADGSPRTDTSTDDTEDKNQMVTSLAFFLSGYTVLESVPPGLLLFFILFSAAASVNTSI